MYIDTHTHLYLDEFEADGKEAAVDRAIAAGVEKMIFPNIDLSTIEPMKLLHAARPEATRMAMGLHPTEVNEGWQETLPSIEEELLGNPDLYIGIGEIGIDFYWDKTFEEQQMQVFERQCLLACEKNLPVIIHCREGLDQTLEVIKEMPRLRGVMHSFGGTTADVERILTTNENMMFGINGIVTFKNCSVRNSLEAITLPRLLLETDSPYLAPVPHRGRRCESAMLIHTAGHIAANLGVTTATLAEATTSNASRLFPGL